MLNIVLIGIATGIDLEFEGDPWVGGFVANVSDFTMVVFTLEVWFLIHSYDSYEQCLRLRRGLFHARGAAGAAGGGPRGRCP